MFIILGQQISTKKENEGERQRDKEVGKGERKMLKKGNCSSPGPVVGLLKSKPFPGPGQGTCLHFGFCRCLGHSWVAQLFGFNTWLVHIQE